jgi:hypothetical protein
MEAMEARLVELLNKQFGAQSKELTTKFTDLQLQLDEQASRLTQMQVKVDLSMDSIGKAHQEQAQHTTARTNNINDPPHPPLVVPGNGQGSGVAGNAPGMAGLGVMVVEHTAATSIQGGAMGRKAPGHALPPQPPPPVRQLQCLAPNRGPQVHFPSPPPLFMRVEMDLVVVQMMVVGNIGYLKWIFPNLMAPMR